MQKEDASKENAPAKNTIFVCPPEIKYREKKNYRIPHENP
jgi:hypothetical protein